MQPTSINDLMETTLSGLEIHIRGVKVNNIQELESELKKLKEEEDEISKFGNKIKHEREST